MVLVSLLSLIFMLNVSPTMALEMEALPLLEKDNKQSSLKTYIVRVQKPKGGINKLSEDLDCWYRSFMPFTTTSSNDQQRMVY